jgi:hypothetical protein
MQLKAFREEQERQEAIEQARKAAAEAQVKQNLKKHARITQRLTLAE